MEDGEGGGGEGKERGASLSVCGGREGLPPLPKLLLVLASAGSMMAFLLSSLILCNRLWYLLPCSALAPILTIIILFLPLLRLSLVLPPISQQHSSLLSPPQVTFKPETLKKAKCVSQNAATAAVTSAIFSTVS